MSDSPPTTITTSFTAGSVTIGFLSILHDSNGVLGGYLVTNAWGRPLEFRLTTAVQPNRVQQILYGPTLTDYLHAELIGKTLVEKSATQPHLIVTDSISALGLQSQVHLPVVAVGSTADNQGLVELVHARSSEPLRLSGSSDREALLDLLERIDPAVDLAEPFTRIREAIGEARKMGVTGRAA